MMLMPFSLRIIYATAPAATLAAVSRPDALPPPQKLFFKGRWIILALIEIATYR